MEKREFRRIGAVFGAVFAALLGCGGFSPGLGNGGTDAVPEPAGDDTYANAAGTIRVSRPPGASWECLEDAVETVQMVKCRSTDPAVFFFFLAKDYTVPPEQAIPAREIVDSVYKADYARFFQTVTYVREEPKRIGPLEGWEIELTAVHASAGSVRKVERVAVEGVHTFLVSAEGAPAAFDTLQAEIAAWMDGATFVNATGEGAR